MSSPLLEVSGLTKRFPGVTALQEVSFDLYAGEIHALCGENGAGKSTLIKTLAGIHRHGSYEGKICFDGREAKFHSIRDAEETGIVVVYQELALVPGMSVAENLFLGNEIVSRGSVDRPAMEVRTRELLARFGVSLDPATPVEKLGTGQQQLVEVVKALAKESSVLILDEPTAALSDAETEILLRILKDLRKSGLSCIYISHRLEEVFELADRITVLRDGRTVGTLYRSDATRDEVIRRMVGREIVDLYPKKSTTPGEVLLEVHELTVVPDRQTQPRVRAVSFRARAGEVLGIGGLMGAGRSEVAMNLFGTWGIRTEGTVELCGQPFPEAEPQEALRRGLALVSEDRKRYGLLLDQSIGFNLSLVALGRLCQAGFVNPSAETESNRAQFDALRIKAPGLETKVRTLSGGNQQKVVLGKYLMVNPKVIILDEPTRGIDVGAKLEVYQIINRLTESGCAVILISSDLPELLGMSDRILVLHEGEVTAELSRDEATPERFLSAAMGHSSLSQS